MNPQNDRIGWNERKHQTAHYSKTSVASYLTRQNNSGMLINNNEIRGGNEINDQTVIRQS